MSPSFGDFVALAREMAPKGWPSWPPLYPPAVTAKARLRWIVKRDRETAPCGRWVMVWGPIAARIYCSLFPDRPGMRKPRYRWERRR